MQEEKSMQEGRSMQEEGRSMQEGKAELRRDQVEGERVGIMIIIMIMIIIFIIIVITSWKERKRMRTNLIVGVSSFEEVKQSRRAMCPGDIFDHLS